MSAEKYRANEVEVDLDGVRVDRDEAGQGHFLTLDPAPPDYGSTVGADGETARSANHRRLRAGTIVLVRGSKANGKLVEARDKNLPLPILVCHVNGSAIFQGEIVVDDFDRLPSGREVKWKVTANPIPK